MWLRVDYIYSPHLPQQMAYQTTMSKFSQFKILHCKIVCVYIYIYIYNYIYIHICACWIKLDQLDVTCFIISLFTAQHVSNVSTFILRSLRLIVDLSHGLYCSVAAALTYGFKNTCDTSHTIIPNQHTPHTFYKTNTNTAKWIVPWPYSNP